MEVAVPVPARTMEKPAMMSGMRPYSDNALCFDRRRHRRSEPHSIAAKISFRINTPRYG